MDIVQKSSRRNILKTGLATIATAAVTTPKANAAIKPKIPGETKVVALMGDYCHNPISQEIHVRSIFSSKKDWRIHFVRASRFLTAELLSDTDLLITARYQGNDNLGWTTEGVVDSQIPGDPYMTDEQEAAIIYNVKNRGMGWLAVHCTLFTGREKIEDFLGIEPIMHQEIQPLLFQNLNQDHPITKDIEPFFVNLDEQFDVILKYPSTTTILFRTLAVHDKRIAISGWCLQQGKGRIVGLLPGHNRWPYCVAQYQEIFWRSAHWAIRHEIPRYPHA